ncbi:MAG: site-specific integrase [Gemmataceae bacterium]
MRQPKPWYRASKDAWFVELGGKQIRLAKGRDSEKQALEAFYRLMSARPENLPPPDRLTVTQLCDLFLDHSQRHHSPDTYDNYRHFLQAFCDAHGRMPAATIKPFHVSRWLDAHTTWAGARRHAVMAVKRAYSWADKQGLLTPNPVRGVEVEPGRRRTRVLSKEEQAEILAAIRDEPFRLFVLAMLETGCRPSEVARVTAGHVNLDLGVWVFEAHKTAKKTGKPRVVYLTPAAVELTRTLVEKHPDGPLFRGPRGGRAFSRNNVRCRFMRLRKKLPHLAHFVCYNLRHTYATQALVNGVGVAQVAELLGHTSTEMVSKVYGHLAGQVAHMREAAKRAAG